MIFMLEEKVYILNFFSKSYFQLKNGDNSFLFFSHFYINEAQEFLLNVMYAMNNICSTLDGIENHIIDYR